MKYLILFILSFIVISCNEADVWGSREMNTYYVKVTYSPLTTEVDRILVPQVLSSNTVDLQTMTVKTSSIDRLAYKIEMSLSKVKSPVIIQFYKVENKISAEIKLPKQNE